jgi:hypothetical protein
MTRENDISRILGSKKRPFAKIDLLVKTGMDEVDADELMEQYEMGQNVPVYYERLDFDRDDDKA